MKGVILAAGYGTRFLPGTKTIPKEMFPLIDTPAIDFIIREFREAGIKDILIISSRRKKALEDYFDREVELETTFAAEGSEKKAELIESNRENIFFLRQQVMAGTGDALLLTEPFVDKAPFVVAYPDDILISGPSLAGEMVKLHEKTGKTVLAVKEILEGDISRYGVLDAREENGVINVQGMIEKPPKGQEPSRLVGFGRYLYTNDLFEVLRATRDTSLAGGEFTQTDAINVMAAKGEVVAHRINGQLLDVGAPQGYLEAVVEYGLSRPDFRDNLLAYLKEVVAREGN